MAKLLIHGRAVPPNLSKEGMEIEPKEGNIEGLLLEAVEEAAELKEVLIKDGRLRTDITILVNGRHCMFLEGLKTKILKGDIVEVLLPMIGG